MGRCRMNTLTLMRKVIKMRSCYSLFGLFFLEFQDEKKEGFLIFVLKILTRIWKAKGLCWFFALLFEKGLRSFSEKTV